MSTPCVCCGRPTFANPPRVSEGPIHMDCWTEHHSDPTEVWPPDHACRVDEPTQDALDFEEPA